MTCCFNEMELKHLLFSSNVCVNISENLKHLTELLSLTLLFMNDKFCIQTES